MRSPGPDDDHVVCELTAADRPALEHHFLALDARDRRLRFGVPPRDQALRAYVERMDFESDAVFGVFDHGLDLIRVAHLAPLEAQAELGLSVLAAHRNRGAGCALLARATETDITWSDQTAMLTHALCRAWYANTGSASAHTITAPDEDRAGRRRLAPARSPRLQGPGYTGCPEFRAWKRE